MSLDSRITSTLDAGGFQAAKEEARGLARALDETNVSAQRAESTLTGLERTTGRFAGQEGLERARRAAAEAARGGLDPLRQSLNEARRATETTTSATTGLAAGLTAAQLREKAFEDASRSAEGAVGSMGRAMVGATSGPVRMSQSLAVLATNLQTVKTDAAAAGVTIRSSLLTALTGPAGIVAAIGAVSLVWSTWGDDITEWIGKIIPAGSEVDTFTGKIDDLTEAFERQIRIRSGLLDVEFVDVEAAQAAVDQKQAVITRLRKEVSELEARRAAGVREVSAEAVRLGIIRPTKEDTEKFAAASGFVFEDQERLSIATQSLAIENKKLKALQDTVDAANDERRARNELVALGSQEVENQRNIRREVEATVAALRSRPGAVSQARIGFGAGEARPVTVPRVGLGQPSIDAFDPSSSLRNFQTGADLAAISMFAIGEGVTPDKLDETADASERLTKEFGLFEQAIQSASYSLSTAFVDLLGVKGGVARSLLSSLFNVGINAGIGFLLGGPPGAVAGAAKGAGEELVGNPVGGSNGPSVAPNLRPSFNVNVTGRLRASTGEIYTEFDNYAVATGFGPPGQQR